MVSKSPLSLFFPTFGRFDEVLGRFDNIFGKFENAFGRFDNSFGRFDDAFGRLDDMTRLAGLWAHCKVCQHVRQICEHVWHI